MATPEAGTFLLKEEGADFYRMVKLIPNEEKTSLTFSVLGKGRSEEEVNVNVKKGADRPERLALAMGWKTVHKAEFETLMKQPPVSKMSRDDAMKVMAWEPDLKQDVEAYLEWMNKQKGARWASRGAARLIRETRMQRVLDLGFNPYVGLDGKRWSERFPDDKEFLALEAAPGTYLDNWQP